MFRLRSYRTKLQLAFLALGLAAIGLTGWEASATSGAALREATYGRLTAIRETRRRQIERYFQDVRSHVLALATDESTIAALEAFRDAWPALPASDPTGARARELRAYYEREVVSRVREEPGGVERVHEWFPSAEGPRFLQHLFLASNPHPTGAKGLLLDAPTAGAYGAAHVRYHPTLYRYQSAFGFYDIFLIGADGRVLYTVSKEIDLGVSLAGEPYRSTGLARAFRAASALREPEETVIQDFAPYIPSYLAPAAFLAAPIWRAGARVGVLAIQVSTAEINRVMTGEHRWADEGLGETGQSYVAGSDGRFRSDLRFEIENPDEFLQSLRNAGADSAVLDRVRRNRTAVLNLGVPQDVAALIQSRARGTATGRNLTGVAVLRSYAPVFIPGLEWTLVAEMNAAEALAPVTRLRNRILVAAVLTAGVFFLVATGLARSVTRPVLNLAAQAARLGGRDFGTRVPVEGDDEVAEMAASFNRMAEELERTTISKAGMDRILASLINAVFVVSMESAESVEEVLASPIERANPAAESLLRHEPGRLSGTQFGSLLPPGDRQWRDLIGRLLRERHLPAVEVLLQPAGAEPVPVLFTAVVLAAEAGQPAGILCAAQDITELRQKRLEVESLAGRLISAQEEERSRVARELHDDLSQRLAVVAMETGSLERWAADATLRLRLARIKKQLASLAEDIHGLSRRLHPSMLYDLGLAAAIESECRSFFERGGAPVDCVIEGDVDSVDPDRQLALFRIVQEALRNVSRHAAADSVTVRLSLRNESIELEVRDDGTGFDRASGDWRPGLGLASMEERARLLGGSLRVESKQGEGTRILVELPVAANS